MSQQPASTVPPDEHPQRRLEPPLRATPPSDLRGSGAELESTSSQRAQSRGSVPAPIQLRVERSEKEPRREATEPSQIALRTLAQLPRRRPQPPAPPVETPAVQTRAIRHVAVVQAGREEVSLGVRLQGTAVAPPVEETTEMKPAPAFLTADMIGDLSEEEKGDGPRPAEPVSSTASELPMPACSPERHAAVEPPEAIPGPEAIPCPEAITDPPLADTDWIREAEALLARIGTAVRYREAFDLGELERIATGMVDAIQTGEGLVVAAFSPRPGSPIVTNMVNVAIFAIKLAQGVGYQRDNLIRLAQAGLVHDIGMFLLPELVLSKPEPLSAQDKALIRQHPDLGYQVLAKLGPQLDWLAQVVWQEHERWGGQGYPRGLKEQQIHEYAQIIGLVDVFEALLSPRPHRPGRMPHEAIRELLAREKQAFPHHLMKRLVEQFSVFPLGTTVRLNTGELGIVTKLNPRHPLRPVVQIIQQADQTPVSELKVVDLSQTVLVHVAMVESRAPRS